MKGPTISQMTRRTIRKPYRYSAGVSVHGVFTATGAPRWRRRCRHYLPHSSKCRRRAGRALPLAKLLDRLLGKGGVDDVVISRCLAFLDIPDLGHQGRREVHPLGTETAVGIPDAFLDHVVIGV